jgi:hypothetical protein
MDAGLCAVQKEAQLKFIESAKTLIRPYKVKIKPGCFIQTAFFIVWAGDDCLNSKARINNFSHETGSLPVCGTLILFPITSVIAVTRTLVFNSLKRK